MKTIQWLLIVILSNNVQIINLAVVWLSAICLISLKPTLPLPLCLCKSHYKGIVLTDPPLPLYLRESSPFNPPAKTPSQLKGGCAAPPPANTHESSQQPTIPVWLTPTPAIQGWDPCPCKFKSFRHQKVFGIFLSQECEEISDLKTTEEPPIKAF